MSHCFIASSYLLVLLGNLNLTLLLYTKKIFYSPSITYVFFVTLLLCGRRISFKSCRICWPGKSIIWYIMENWKYWDDTAMEGRSSASNPSRHLPENKKEHLNMTNTQRMNLLEKRGVAHIISRYPTHEQSIGIICNSTNLKSLGSCGSMPQINSSLHPSPNRQEMLHISSLNMTFTQKQRCQLKSIGDNVLEKKWLS